MTGPELAAIRKRLGLTQVALAPLLGYHGSSGGQSISDIERGVKPVMPAVAILAATYDRLGVPADSR